MEIHTWTEWRAEAAERAAPNLFAVRSRHASVQFAFSLSIQRNMYNYKGYKKGSDINRQKYTELLYTCLSNVRKSSYTHAHIHTHSLTHSRVKNKTKHKTKKTERKSKECRVTFRYLQSFLFKIALIYYTKIEKLQR